MKHLISVIALAAGVSHGMDAMSPDGAMTIRWEDQTRDRRTISLLASHTMVWSTRTFPRYTRAAWRSDSKACVIWNAPDNANTQIWLVRRDGQRIRVSSLSYVSICQAVESARSDLRTEEPKITRSGIQTVRWISSDCIEICMVYNSVELRLLAKIRDGGFGSITVTDGEPPAPANPRKARVAEPERST